ncbi:MAG: ferredoxin [Lapillicoccus sp.]
MPSPSETRTTHRTLPFALDRIACTGHGICASILPEQISLDEWGYPVVQAALVDPALGDAAIRLCPARALTWSRQQAATEARR